MSEERKINGINDFLQMSMTNNMPLSVNEKRQIFDLIIKLQNQLQQKENIIKEVREYIKENTSSYYTNIEETNEELELICNPEELLEILDKGKENEQKEN